MLQSTKVAIAIIALCSSVGYGQSHGQVEVKAIYRVVFNDVCNRQPEDCSDKELLVISPTISTHLKLSDVDTRFRRIIKPFNSMNRIPTVLGATFEGLSSLKLKVITQNEVDELFAQGQLEYKELYEKEKNPPGLIDPGGDSWGPFFRRFPHSTGLFSVSRVVFLGREAVVQKKYETTWRGFATTYLLRKRNAKWRATIARASIWVS